MKSTILIASLTLATLLSAAAPKLYEGCAATKQEAVYTLSGNIQSRISTSFVEDVEVKNSDVKSKISTYTSAKSNLSLVNIEYKKKGQEVCAVVSRDDQVKNTQKLLKQALLYNEKDLPNDVDSKIEKLSKWIDNIEQLSYLIPVFLKESDKEQALLNAKEKKFRDLYAQSIAYSDSLFFKSCKATREKAKAALNKDLFTNREKKEEKGFFSSIGSLFSSDETETDMLDLFDTQLLYAKKGSKECVMFKKEELLAIAKKMNADLLRVSQKSLSKDPKKRYKEIESYYHQIQVAKLLFKLFPNEFSKSAFSRLDDVKRELAAIQAKTYPQYVLFNISGGEQITILLDSKPIKNNEKVYIKNGEHTYKISAKGKCPVVETFSNDLFDDETIAKSLESQSYPTVIFLTDQTPSIVVNGQSIRPNVTTTLKSCEGESHYLVKYAGQTLKGEVDTSAGATSTVELNFLTPQELRVFTDAKTKKFTTESGIPFSESLTDLFSEKLKFSVEESPAHGKLELHERGSFKYVSEKGFVGVDTFEYTIEGPQKSSAPKVVTIKVTQSESLPKAAAVVPVAVKKAKDEAKKVEKKAKELQKDAVKKKELPKAEDKKEAPKKSEKPKVSYEDFKRYVETKELTVELMQKLQKKFPVYFNRLRDEKIHH